MKASKLIREIKKITDEHGDVLVDINMNDRRVHLVDEVSASLFVEDGIHMITLSSEEVSYERIKADMGLI